MSEDGSFGSDPARLRHVTTALWLVSVSVAFGMLSGAISVTTGLADHSLGVLADVAGSAVLIRRFRVERRQPGQSGPAEARAAIIVAIALAVVSIVLIVQSAGALASGSGTSFSAVRSGRPM